MYVNCVILLLVGDASSVQTLQNLQSLAALASVAGNTGISKSVLTQDLPKGTLTAVQILIHEKNFTWIEPPASFWLLYSQIWKIIVNKICISVTNDSQRNTPQSLLTF